MSSSHLTNELPLPPRGWLTTLLCFFFYFSDHSFFILDRLGPNHKARSLFRPISICLFSAPTSTSCTRFEPHIDHGLIIQPRRRKLGHTRPLCVRPSRYIALGLRVTGRSPATATPRCHRSTGKKASRSFVSSFVGFYFNYYLVNGVFQRISYSEAPPCRNIPWVATHSDSSLPFLLPPS